MSRKDTRDSRFIKAFQEEQMKVWIERIDPGTDDRIKVIYEAHADTEDGQDCIKTVYIYDNASDDPKYSLELKAKWNGQWDTDAETLANALGYDLEGNAI